jgi:glyoxylase-like metal-dependent hydrolase (beta-lactamase superfamily II)
VIESLGEGLHRIRLPLPWSGLDHVWSYALEGASGWTLFDTGLGTAETAAAWTTALQQLGGPVARIVISHYHTDHIGASRDLAALTGAEVLMSPTDATQSRHWHDPDAVASTRRHLEVHGCPEEVLDSVFSAWEGLVANVHPAAPTRLIDDGDVLVGAGEAWRVVPVPGHADGQIALFGTRSRRLLAADAILDRIAPFVGVHPVSRPDPLGDHLATLERLGRLDVAVAHPGHFDAIADVAGRAAELREHHAERLRAHRAVLADGPADAYAASLRIYGDRLGPNSRRIAVVESLAHLVHLERRGEIERHVGRGGRVVFSAR